MSNFIFDLLCYGALLWILIAMTRVRAAKKVTLKLEGRPLVGKVVLVTSGLGTRVGLLNTPTLALGDGILLSGTKSVHTVGMNYPIDLVFLDESHRILLTKEAVSPGTRRVKGPKGTRHVLELGAGSLARDFQNIPPHVSIEVSHE